MLLGAVGWIDHIMVKCFSRKHRLCLAFSLSGLMMALSPASPSLAKDKQSVTNGVGSEFELMFWRSVADSGDRTQLEAYLSQYPGGTFAGLARAKIAALPVQASATPAAPPPAPVAAPATATAGPISAPVSPTASTLAAAPLPIPTAVVPAPLPAAPALSPPPAAPSAAAPAPVSPAAALAEQLRMLSATQGTQSVSLGTIVPPSTARATLPARPALSAVPELRLPPSFCSSLDRNAFYDSDYRSAMDVADRNNQAAIAHMQTLQKLFDEYGQRNDPASMNLFAGEAQTYKAIAAASFAARSAFDPLFSQLMAVPIIPCEEKK